MQLFENALQTAGILKRQLCVIGWTEDILKMKLLEDDGRGYDNPAIFLKLQI